MATILVIDPSPAVRETLRIVLGEEHVVAVAASWDEVAGGAPPDLVIYGAPLFPRDDARAGQARAHIAPGAPLLLLNAPREVDADAIAGPGARVDCLPKPFHLHALRTRVQALLAPAAPPTPSESTVERHRRWLEHPFVASAAAELARRATLADLPVLLIGEAGTGVIELASAIHFFSGGHAPVCVRGARELDLATLAPRRGGPAAVVIENVHELSRDAQHALLESLRDTRTDRIRIFATSDADLAPRVASGAMVPELAYALAPFTIALTPLRERPADVPALAEKVTADLITRLRLEPVTYTEAALARLQRYLWFGNVAELEAVLARTLAVHRPRIVEPDALLFAEVEATRALAASPPSQAVTARVVAFERSERRRPDGAERTPVEADGDRSVAPERPEHVHAAAEPHSAARLADRRSTGGNDPSLEVLLGELAHELRNPMVTIKTFAQHLDSVLADPESRERFASLTGEAITRMDALLETLLDFARFRAPECRPIDLTALLARALAERTDELARKSVRVEVPHNGSGAVLVEADEGQVLFALRSLLEGLVRDLVSHEPMRVAATADGALELAVHADRAIAARLAAYVAGGDDAAGVAHPPLAFALATALIRRNHGALEVRSAADGAMVITVSLPRPARQARER